jgi:predicted XRE-type DNA-binding protein
VKRRAPSATSPKPTARSVELRSQLMRRIEQFYRESGMTRARAANMLRITPERLDAVVCRRVGSFSLDALVKMLSRAGFEVRLIIANTA